MIEYHFSLCCYNLYYIKFPLNWELIVSSSSIVGLMSSYMYGDLNKEYLYGIGCLTLENFHYCPRLMYDTADFSLSRDILGIFCDKLPAVTLPLLILPHLFVGYYQVNKCTS